MALRHKKKKKNRIKFDHFFFIEEQQKKDMSPIPHHALQFNFSVDIDWLGTWTQELEAWCKKYTLWYAIKHEKGENGKVHLHAGIVFEKVTNENVALPYVGPRRIDNLKRSLVGDRPQLPQLASYIIGMTTQKYAIVISAMMSSIWICEYLQKEGELEYHRMPKDIIELGPYFSDLLGKKKDLSPELIKWCDLYAKYERPEPATLESCLSMQYEHMTMVPFCVNDPIKAVYDHNKILARAKLMVCSINQTIDMDLFSGLKRKRNDHPSEQFRVCPRCIEKDRDSPNLLEKREQYCSACKAY